MRDLVLVMESSTATGSLALVRGVDVVGDSEVAMRGPDGERLMPALVALLDAANASPGRLARVVCSAGPGGFTSLRIAAAIAKGLHTSLGVEVWAVSSLALLAAGAGGARSRPVLAILDAQRGEWYSQRFARDGNGHVTPAEAGALRNRESLAREAEDSGAVIVGVGGETFVGGVEAVPRARNFVALSGSPLLRRVDASGWEPDYGRLAEAQVKWEAAHGRALTLHP